MSSEDIHDAESASGWDEWLAASVADLQRRSLFRTLRPTVPGLSAVEVGATSQCSICCRRLPPPLKPALPCCLLISTNACPAAAFFVCLASLLQASMPQADIDAWVEGRAPASAAMPSLAAAELRTIKLFSLNDYLGLSSHPDVRAAAADAALKFGNGEEWSDVQAQRGWRAWGVSGAAQPSRVASLPAHRRPLAPLDPGCRPAGPRSSALVGGYTHVHAQLERELARLKGTEACLLFPTGYAANLAVLASLASPGDSSGGGGGELFILSDELNHASIVDGAALARRRTAARLLVYRHADLAHLAALLEGEVPHDARAVVVTDSLFSMDGDFADLAGLAELKRRRPFLLVRRFLCGGGGVCVCVCVWEGGGGGSFRGKRGRKGRVRLQLRHTS
jgi:8-amino-7-oxononanoate synthase